MVGLIAIILSFLQFQKGITIIVNRNDDTTTTITTPTKTALQHSTPQQQQQQQPLPSSSTTTTTLTNTTTNTTIELLMSPTEIEWLQQRPAKFKRWFRQSMMDFQTRKQIQPFYDVHMRYFRHNVDLQGPWLDFLIVGFPKCGTTTLMATLGEYVAPMPIQDVCEWPPTILTRAYTEWPRKHGGANKTTGITSSLLLRGSKCPSSINSLGGAYLKIFTNSFQRTKLIIGIRYVLTVVVVCCCRFVYLSTLTKDIVSFQTSNTMVPIVLEDDGTTGSVSKVAPMSVSTR
jgi:hypothetical protein